MSQDILLNAYCTHIILKQRVIFADPARRVLIFNTPVAESASVKLYMNGVWVPQEGVNLPARVILNKRLPFNIPSEGSLTVTCGNSNPETVSIPAGYYTPQKYQSLFKNSKLVSATLSNNVLILTDRTGRSGLKSILNVTGMGYTLTGKGSQPYPAWSLDREGADEKLIRFSKPVFGDPIITADYRTPMASCYRCMGSGIENDYNFNIFGDVKLISDENLLYQACMKVVLTDIGTNPFHSWYGSDLQTKIGAKMLMSLAGEINKSVSTALRKFQDLQKNQAKFQDVSLKETFYKIVDISVTADDTVDQLYNVDVTVANGSNEPIALNIRYSTAQVAPSFAGVNPYLGS